MPISVAIAVNVRSLIKEASEHLSKVTPGYDMKSAIAMRCVAVATYEFNRGCEVSAINTSASPQGCYVDALENMQLLLRSNLEFAAHEEVADEIVEAARAIRDSVLLLPLPN